MSLHVMTTVISGNIIIANNALNGELPRKSVLFNTMTSGYVMVMDYRTFLDRGSIGFPGCRNYVFVNDASCLQGKYPNIVFVTAAKDVITLAKNENVFVIGEPTHKDFLRDADIIHIVSVGTMIPGKNKSFPEIKGDTWELRSEFSFSSDPENIYPFKWQTYARKA